MEIPELVGSIAEAYMVVGLWQDAVETFTPLTRCDTVRSFLLILAAA